MEEVTVLLFEHQQLTYEEIRKSIIALDKVFFFNQKVPVFFLFLDEKICYGYSLEAPR